MAFINFVFENFCPALLASIVQIMKKASNAGKVDVYLRLFVYFKCLFVRLVTQ
jgi:hypothetical protein